MMCGQGAPRFLFTILSLQPPFISWLVRSIQFSIFLDWSWFPQHGNLVTHKPLGLSIYCWDPTYQTINTLAVVPSALMLYDFAITLDKEVEYIWKKSMSIVSLIYFMLRYFGTIFVLFYTGVLVRYWHAQGQANNYIFPVTQIWPQVVANWLVHVILQMRLYVLYNRSKKVIFVVVLGFVIEVASTLVTMIRISIFEANNLFNQKVSFTGFPATEAINIYINYAGVFLYECLLFFFALWAGIQCSRCPSVTRGIGARLRVILIQGNVVYFLVVTCRSF
ncbi:hypothetical protein V8B97DRAFT_476915 [Scleroderma yunnanense]